MHSQNGINLRAVLYMMIAANGALNVDTEFRSHVPWWVITTLTTVTAMLLALRIYIDQSTSNIKPKPEDAGTTSVTETKMEATAVTIVPPEPIPLTGTADLASMPRHDDLSDAK